MTGPSILWLSGEPPMNSYSALSIGLSSCPPQTGWQNPITKDIAEGTGAAQRGGNMGARRANRQLEWQVFGTLPSGIRQNVGGVT